MGKKLSPYVLQYTFHQLDCTFFFLPSRLGCRSSSWSRASRVESGSSRSPSSAASLRWMTSSTSTPRGWERQPPRASGSPAPPGGRRRAVSCSLLVLKCLRMSPEKTRETGNEILFSTCDLCVVNLKCCLQES